MKLACSRLAIPGIFAVLIALAVPQVLRERREEPMEVNRVPAQPHDGPSRPTERSKPVETDRRPGDAPGDRERRERMVESQLRGRDITDKGTLEAMARVPRHMFVPELRRGRAYDDTALPIPLGQTISQPYIVALMTQLAQLHPDSRVLDVGTGSGYQAAVLAEIVEHVSTIEILCDLADEARSRLVSLNYENVDVRWGDGYQGWPEKAPFDAIIVAAAPDHVPQPLIDQLAPNGRLILPVGRFYQELVVIEKSSDGNLRRRTVAPVAFVPMTGEAQKQNGKAP